MSKFKTIVIGFGVGVGAVLAGQVGAAPVAFGSSGLPSPTNVIDFGELTPDPADGEELTTQFQGEGITFDAAGSGLGVQFNPVGANSVPGANIVDSNVGNFQGGQAATNPIFINFVNPTTGLSQPVSDALFNLATSGGTTTFTSFLGGVQVETFSANTDISRPDNFFGFTDSNFDRISISTVSGDNANLFDNLQFVAVPEPAGLALVGLGGLALAARRRR